MTIDELIRRLTDLRDEHGGDAEVRLMTQQNWPFENGIHGVTTSTEMALAGEDEDDEPADESKPVVIFIVEGDQLGYGDKAAWTACD